MHTLSPFYFMFLLKPVFTEVQLLSSVTEVMGIVRDFLPSFLIQLSMLSFPLHGLSAYLTLKGKSWDFPDGLVVRTLSFHCRGHGFDPWPGN